jgi:hypothetical protein
MIEWQNALAGYPFNLVATYHPGRVNPPSRDFFLGMYTSKPAPFSDGELGLTEDSRRLGGCEPVLQRLPFHQHGKHGFDAVQASQEVTCRLLLFWCHGHFSRFLRLSLRNFGPGLGDITGPS